MRFAETQKKYRIVPDWRQKGRGRQEWRHFRLDCRHSNQLLIWGHQYEYY